MIEQGNQNDNKLHIAIIMDGNGRWATARGRPRAMGHKAGIEALRRTLEAVREFPVSHLTLYSFSSENWSRPESEVSELMGLLRFYLKSELATLHKNNVRLRVIGERDLLALDIRSMIEKAEQTTAANTALNLTLALSYGGRQEIVAATQKIARDVAAGKVKPEEVSEKLLSANLYTHDLPDPDLVIRTSGEKRTSNFLIWQSAYAEYVFQDVLWPDFSGEHLKAAIEEYNTRERRFGR
ncbi:MAG: isoprenyl transferase [Proteobacteria bacterium]|nr:isoprenyl transferase [Alphaproteobacteria bacterium]NCC02890.1 isoprenyl transferase [Pseudomonadota bacterium]